MVTWLSLLPFLIGYLSMLADPARQTWGDKAAGALVVRDPNVVLD